jgi:catechol 2,3-dioxygenase-like lactoylglutathione lyase family enzyme
MKRFHVHVGVPDLAASIRFYSDLFGAAPTVQKPDYAKWMIDDPRVNFAISQRGTGRTGVDHLGLQAESDAELAAIRTRFEAADAASIVDEPDVRCCYARGDKHWVTDPQGIAWEAFHTLESVPIYGDTQAPAEAGCCTPNASDAKGDGPRVSKACCTPGAIPADSDALRASKSCCA